MSEYCTKHQFNPDDGFDCPHCEDEKMKSLTAEVRAWRERFPKLYYRSMDDCIVRREL